MITAFSDTTGPGMMTVADSRTYGYLRVSTAEQSADNQRLELTQAGYDIPSRRWFSDSISGKVPALQRTQFAKLMERLEAGDTLVVAKLDRLGRDSMDVEHTIRSLEDAGISVVVLQLGRNDLTSTAGKLIRRVLAAVADMERSMLIERTQAGLASAKAEGKVLGRRPKTNERQRAEIKTRRASGETISALARDYKVSRATVLSIVR